MKIRSTRTSNLIPILLITFSVAGLLLVIFSSNPIEGMRMFFLGPFMSAYSMGNLMGKMNLLILTGMGAFLAFQAGVFNLGGEGQVYLGGLVFVILSLMLPPGLPGFFLALVLTAGAGFVLAGASGVLKNTWQVDELITTFLISRGIFPAVDAAMSLSFLKDPESYLIATLPVKDSHRFAPLLSPSSWNTSFFLSLVLLLLLTYFLFATLAGYRLRLTGSNREFAYYGGIRVGLFTILPMAFSGAFHSLAGGILAAGYHGRMIQSFSGGIGWNGIAVALIARKHPLAILPSAFLMAYLEVAAQGATIHSDFPFELGFILQGMVLLLVTLQNFPTLRRHKG